MENIKNIKYKKKYHKYKNKYHKIIQNHQMKGGASGISIVAVILTIIALLGLGTGIYMNNESIKTWFDSNYELIKKRIQNLRRAEQIDIQNKQEKKLEIQERKISLSKTQDDLQEAKNIKKKKEFAHNQLSIDEAIKKQAEETRQLLQQQLQQQQQQLPGPPPPPPGSSPGQPEGVPISDKVGLIYQNVETIKTQKGTPVQTYYDELNSILKLDGIEISIEKDWDIDPGSLPSHDKIKNIKVKLNPITKQEEVHWDFNTRHFYWTPNRNKEDKRVLIKYYPAFGNPNDISVYELKTFGIFEEFNPDIKILLPEKLLADKQKEMNKEKIALIKEKQKNVDLLKKEGETIIKKIISKEKQNDAITEFKKMVLVDNYLKILSEIILKYTSSGQKQENLRIVKIRGDGWCQFHSIIDQLLQTDKQKLITLQNNYDDSSNYKNISDTDLKKKIREFIRKLINNIDSNNRKSSDALVENLLNIMINFIQLYGNFTIYECNNADGNLGQSINFVEKIWMELFIKDDQNSFTIDKFDYELIRDAFIQYYKYPNDTEEKHWGGDSTLILIRFIFNLEINLYTNTILSEPKKNHKLVLGQKECNVEDNSLIEINLLYSDNNHYDSVRKK